MRVIFLDVDGVLNNHDFDPAVMCGLIHADKVALLNGIIKATDAKIVLSSAWRYIIYRGECNLIGMEWLLRSHGLLADRLIGITRMDTMTRGTFTGLQDWPQPNERGDQIADWLEAHSPAQSYVAIDDLDLGISDAGHPFVQTNGKVGLTAADAGKAIEILSQATTRAA